MWLQVLLFSALPFIAMSLGGVIPTVRRPNTWFKSFAHHFAAGVIFAVATVELLPEAMHDLTPLSLSVSFLAGVGLMFGIEQIAHRLQPEKGAHHQASAGLLIAMAIDCGIDGILIGIGFALGAGKGLLLALALALEGLILGVVIATSLVSAGQPRRRVVATVSGIGFMFVVGGMTGGLAMAGLPRAQLGLVLAFGLAALLYLVTEELLLEAAEIPETPVTSASFFIGFLLFVVLGMLLH